MNYIQVLLHFDITDIDPEVVASLLTTQAFDSFEETPDGLIAYIPDNEWNKQEFEQRLPGIFDGRIRLISCDALGERNWNELWESNFPAVTIGRCRIRAPFHEPDPAMPLELVIEPKMSFGTAHHETTAMMIELQLDMEWNGLEVLDMGCGTGILSIVAAKLGAGKILAIDNDKWAYENSLENIARNNVESRVTVKLGDASLLTEGSYDVVIANINRNILLRDMTSYVAVMKPGSQLMLSGFYSEDLKGIKQAAVKLGLSYLHHLEKNNWVAAVFNY